MSYIKSMGYLKGSGKVRLSGLRSRRRVGALDAYCSGVRLSCKAAAPEASASKDTLDDDAGKVDMRIQQRAKAVDKGRRAEPGIGARRRANAAQGLLHDAQEKVQRQRLDHRILVQVRTQALWFERRSGSQPLAALPDDPRAKQTENRIAGDQAGGFQFGLGGQYPVERVLVLQPITPCAQTVQVAHRKVRKAVGLHQFMEAFGCRARPRQLAEAELGGAFPGAGRADQNQIAFVLDGGPGAGGKLRAVGPPPEQGGGCRAEASSAFPGRQFDFRHGLEEFRPDLSIEAAGPPPACFLRQRRHPRIRLAGLGEDDLLPRMGLLQEPRELSLRFVNVDDHRH